MAPGCCSVLSLWSTLEGWEVTLPLGTSIPSRQALDCRGPPTNGENWYNVRTVLNTCMPHSKDSLNGVVTDFIKRMYYLCQCIPTGDLVTNMANELYHFSLEGM
ncbi:Sterol 26-hydroxylase, mitochondrial [Collichthys lucidus]|uniref:Sterol 26-hydroxylase, mitochondrial n=1 Tax=Collichthys lucidus TaxID=240159 RepID=A0A4U5VVM0_COLLU|nr:Sterol 26-hydroxylase, mitochondrial [Collichthys lucidus]